MSGGFSGDFKEQVRSQTDLVALIGETVSLTPRGGGGEHVGLCPFHDDHSPSMHVYPERQTYRCWVCDEGGDCFSWVMRIENVEFREALEQLAERANLEMPRRRQTSGPDRDERSRLYDVLSWAEEQFHQCLVTDAEATRARAYLSEQRRLSPEIAARFRVGFHPPVWDWLQQRASGRFTNSELEAAGLVKQRQDGSGLRDDFVDRVVFPIHDPRGRTVAFGGRILPDHSYADAPKYLNSSESPVFSKKSLLYGLDLSRGGIRREKAAVVVEGYTDCVTAHQYGLDHVVGTLGTALTDEHVTRLKRLAERVVLVYDGDQAGQMAAERALPRFLAQDVDLRVLTLPEGLDPAEFLERHGETAFRQLADDAPEAWEFKYQGAVSRIGSATVDARQRLLSEMLELIVLAPRLAGTAREALILGRLSQRLGLSEPDLRNELQQHRRRRSDGAVQRVDPGTRSMGTSDQPSGAGSKKASGPSAGRVELAEQELLEILLSTPESISRIHEQVRPDELRHAALQELLATCYRIHEEGEVPTFARVSSVLEDPEMKSLAVKIDEQARLKGTSQRVADPELDLIEETVQVLKWRREQENYESDRGLWSERSEASGRLDDEDKARLKRAFEHHQKRMQRKVVR